MKRFAAILALSAVALIPTETFAQPEDISRLVELMARVRRKRDRAR